MIDTDLFQTIALALLFLILLVQLIQLALVNRMKQSGDPRTTGAGPLEEPASTMGYGAATTSYGGAGSYEPAGYAGSAGYAGGGESAYGGYTGTATTASPATTATPAAATPTETAPAAEARPEVATSYVPLEQATPATQAEPVSGGARLTGDEPEEQPFERDGRWWFKRGGELLVYDEGTGQWVAAPGGGSGAPSAAAAATSSGATATTGTSTYAAADSGEGWRCASCGAINGSTATVCRMCFTPRA